MNFKRTTEETSKYTDIDKMSTSEIIQAINQEDLSVAKAIQLELPAIEILCNKVADTILNGGRIFYIGAGTSGRLGILDASECPPTFGVPHGLVVGLIAGGDTAIRKAVEFAEDSKNQAWEDLKSYAINKKDIVIGLAASGSTPYVLGGLEACNKNGIATGSITCNKNSPIDKTANYPVCVVVGPEFITGSSRMKAGTAQKMILNMITTSSMIKLGRIKGNKMVDMQLSNNKLIDRAERILIEELNISETEAANLIVKHRNVRDAIIDYENSQNR